jgi:hypothetical protein
VSACTCPPGGPYHRWPCPCQAAYHAKHAADLAACQTSLEHAELVAAELVLQGYEQISRKYRLVDRDGDDELELDLLTFEAFRRRAEDRP